MEQAVIENGFLQSRSPRKSQRHAPIVCGEAPSQKVFGNGLDEEFGEVARYPPAPAAQAAAPAIKFRHPQRSSRRTRSAGAFRTSSYVEFQSLESSTVGGDSGRSALFRQNSNFSVPPARGGWWCCQCSRLNASTDRDR